MKPGMVESTLKTGVGQFAGLLLGAISVKLLAVIAGPAGVGLFSVLRHLQQTFSSIASIGGQNAVVQGLSSRTGIAREQFLASSFYVFLAAISLLSLLILLGADYFALWVLDGEHASAIRWLVLPMSAGALLFYFRGLLTAEMQFGALAMVNIVIGLGAALVALPVGLAYSRGHADALVLLVAGGLVPGLLVAFFHVRRLGYFDSSGAISLEGVNWAAIAQFLRVALPALFSTFFTLGSVLIVRAYIVRYEGLEGAGHFDAAWSISAMYLALFLVSLQSYLLPELSQQEDGGGLREALAKTFHFALLISLPLITGLVVMKPLATHVLFSGEFRPALEILRWVLLGDYVRVLGWIITTVLIARADMKGFLFAEGLWSVVFLLMSIWLVPRGGEWVGVAYLLAYISYLGFLVWRMAKVHGVFMPGRNLLHWLVGFGLVAIVALLCWNDSALVSWNFILIIPAILFSFFIMRAEERVFARQLTLRVLTRIKGFGNPA